MILEHSCPLCENSLRDKNVIMIVESLKDLMVIENSNTYNCLYHITNGIIDLSKGIEPKDLNIDSLFNRLNNVNEVIIAFSGTMMGDLTGNYIKELVKDKEYTLVIDPPIGDGYGVGLLEYHVVFNGEYFKLDDNYDNSNVIDIEWN